ncbi:mannitol dehydrogenase family protein [Mesobaculum littorinae]|uniref:Mannitol dehydrogenase family protein n=1 Tax=Mesobaculum littorinae TaxID=2486419 RepID=A0A438AI40_9RHOB|nr:mannitol dehydrogenase family protein [Mesobaculum littorinae]RVV98295.1 mannitol dehydrogenase family protein [Mesobaculum littorinae]
MTRLSETQGLPDDVRVPAYDRAALGEGIVHLGLGAFQKSHLAVYTDDALARSGGDWRIVGVSLRSDQAVRDLTPQNGLFTVIEAGVDGTQARVVGAVSRALAHAHGDAEAVRAVLADPATRIVTITVTEKGYGLDRARGGADPQHPAIAHDLVHPEAPVGVAGLLVQALAARRAAGVPPFTILSCDNLPGNGDLVRGLILDVAGRRDPALRDWIAGAVACPNAMVDRITPAPDAEVRAMAAAMTGRTDAGAILTERFRQWVIEDRFPEGRPDWEAGGALFVEDVAPYEHMKLRMLNGSHSMIAYAGVLTGHTHVRDVMADAALARLVRRHLAAAAATLAPLPGIDFAAYGDDLARRFANPHLAHRTAQIAMDGTEKMPQRIYAPARDARTGGQDLRPFAFATALWMRFALGRHDDGTTFDLNDPRSDEIAARLQGATTAPGILAALTGEGSFLPTDLADDTTFAGVVTDILADLLERGAAATIADEARAAG